MLGQAGRQLTHESQSKSIRDTDEYFNISNILVLKGVYVLTDNAFKPLLRISSFEGQMDALKKARIVRFFVVYLTVF